MNKGAVNYIVRLLAERILGAVLFWLGAGKFDLRSGIFFSVYVPKEILDNPQVVVNPFSLQ